MSDDPWLRRYPDNVDWNAEIPVKPLYALFDDSRERYPNHKCIDFLGRRFTYAEIGEQIDRAAAGFVKLGVRSGVRVGLFLPNCPQFVVAYYGILRAGGTVVCYSPLYAEAELQHQVEDSGTRFMVTLNLKVLYPKMRALLDKGTIEKLIVGNLPEVLPFPKNLLYPLAKAKDVVRVPNDSRHLSFGELLNNSGVHEPARIDAKKDIAVLQYTGGTTGVSKGAMLTHANLYANTVQAQLWFTGIEPGAERMLGVLPFFHIFAMTVVMNYSIHIGAEIVMHPRFELDAVLKDIDKKKPTLMPGVPTMFAAINGHANLAKFDLGSIKACISGGAPLPLEVKQRFEKLTGCKLVEGYGLTEAAPIVTANPLEGLYKEGSIGLPLPGTRVTITDREDPHKVLDLGERGEICVTGPQVMAGYWNRPEDTAAVLVEGRLRTGDVGYMDEDGYTFIIDRIKDLVLVSGFNVYPRNVEEGVYQHSAVAECTVIGIADDYTGEAVKAFVKLKEGKSLGAEELSAFLKDKLGKHELPKHIEFRDELPKTMVGKLSKKELVAEEAAKAAAAKAETRAAASS